MQIGVDTGGTFTDIVAFDQASGLLDIHKVSSTPDNPAQAVLDGVCHMLDKHRCPPTDVEALVHGTTVATNAVLTGSWAKTALVTTEGFRDVLEIGRQTRPDLYDFFAQKPEPLIPRSLRFEVPERLDYAGRVVRPLDEDAVRKLAQTLAQANVQSVAVVLLFAYLNPQHEQRVREILSQTLELPIVLSSETLPEFREYERTSTTALNAALLPVLDRYLRALEEETKALGIQARWRIMQSNAGIASASFARRMPVTLLLSGPAGGVEGARFVGTQTGNQNLITLDMGGTSCDVALIHQGRAQLSSEGQIAGRPVRVPMVEMHTIGAGGGSIAWIDAGGALRVGPQSAGAAPGPVCYGRGGTSPTVTDAQLVLGRFNPQEPLGDIPALDLEAARQAIEEHIATPLKLSLEGAAAGILAVADAHMEQAIRLISIERGHDPRRFGLLGFGGAGPLHACALAQRLNIPRIIVPNAAGVLSAFGLLTAEPAHHFVQTVLSAEDKLEWPQINALFDTFRKEAKSRFEADGMDPNHLTFLPSIDLRYAGQSFELNVPVVDRALSADDWAMITQRFHQAHLQRYGHCNENECLEVVNLRLAAVGRADKPAFPTLSRFASPPNPKQRRLVYFEPKGWTDCPIYERKALQPTTELTGPAVLEGAESTVVVLPGQRLSVTPHGHLIVEET